MTQKTGALIFDETADRYDIRFDVNDLRGQYHGGLLWGKEAYPYGVRGRKDLSGLRVRI